VKRSIPGVQFGGRVIGTEEAWALAELPKSMAVVGAGASGAEIASADARLGTAVQLFEALDRVLPAEDADISKLAERGFERQGVDVGAGTVYGDRAGLVKIIGERRYGEILGGHIVGAKSTDLIQELINAKTLEAGFPEVARTIHGHPTMSEAVMEAARAADGWLIHG
jgi:pyruvate/2-oxoglutarate dehydrogenase complex dihydrolipoamide dehydrogenase (E3) component